MKTQTVKITGESIELFRLLKYSGLAETGGQAKDMIREGLVSVGGSVATELRKQVRNGDTVILWETTLQVEQQ